MNSEEYGSCQSSSDCAYRTPAQPYCSAFGYCTQVHETQANLPKKNSSRIFFFLSVRSPNTAPTAAPPATGTSSGKKFSSHFGSKKRSIIQRENKKIVAACAPHSFDLENWPASPHSYPTKYEKVSLARILFFPLSNMYETSALTRLHCIDTYGVHFFCRGLHQCFCHFNFLPPAGGIGSEEAATMMWGRISFSYFPCFC